MIEESKIDIRVLSRSFSAISVFRPARRILAEQTKLCPLSFHFTWLVRMVLLSPRIFFALFIRSVLSLLQPFPHLTSTSKRKRAIRSKERKKAQRKQQQQQQYAQNNNLVCGLSTLTVVKVPFLLFFAAAKSLLYWHIEIEALIFDLSSKGQAKKASNLLRVCETSKLFPLSQFPSTTH